jgi:hypothetical protein
VFTVIVTALVEVQPFAPVTVTVYVVVAVGEAVGLDTVVELNPVAGDHEYELPATAVAPIEAEVVVHVNVAGVPALAAGGVVFTVIVTELVAVHPFAPVTVTVYVVVAVGVATGFDIVVELNPVAGDHEYVFPATEVAPIVAEVVVQVNVAAEPAFTDGAFLFTVTVTVLAAVQPFVPVTVTV